MAHISYFFATIIVCSVLVRGQSPPPPASTPPIPGVAPVVPAVTPDATPTPGATTPGATTPGATTPGATPTPGGPVQASPECAPLATKSLDDMPFVTGESIWWVGKLYVSASATGATPTPTPGATTPLPGAPAPVPGAPAPVPGAPAPVPGAPAPVPGAPAPVPGAPAPVPGAPAPVPGSPTPTPGAPAAPCGNNQCSITSYTPDSCQSIKLLISQNEDGTIHMKEATFNKATNSVSLITNNWLPADPSKAILKQTFGFYGTMDQGGVITISDPAPQEVKTAQATDLVLIGSGDGDEWALFSTCCKSVVFVIYNDATICAKSQKNFDQAISALLAPLGIKPEDLKDIPTDMTIKLDAFIQPLPPPAAAAAPTTPGATAPTPGATAPTPGATAPTPGATTPTPGATAPVPAATTPGATPTPGAVPPP